MKRNYILLGAFDLVIAFAAIFTGFLMLWSNQGIFREYPSEWLNVFPFRNWAIPGILAITFFGAGNIAAALFSFRGRGSKAWLVSAVTGFCLLLCAILQIMILGQWFLATAEVLLISLLQLFLSGYALFGVPHD